MDSRFDGFNRLADTADTGDDGPTVQEVYDSMTAEQKEVVHYMVGAALEEYCKM